MSDSRCPVFQRHSRIVLMILDVRLMFWTILPLLMERNYRLYAAVVLFNRKKAFKLFIKIILTVFNCRLLPRYISLLLLGTPAIPLNIIFITLFEKKKLAGKWIVHLRHTKSVLLFHYNRQSTNIIIILY